MIWCNVTYITCDGEHTMSIGNSGRIVIEVEPKLKRQLYSALTQDGLSLKEWFLKNAEGYISVSRQKPIQTDSSSTTENSSKYTNRETVEAVK